MSTAINGYGEGSVRGGIFLLGGGWLGCNRTIAAADDPVLLRRWDCWCCLGLLFECNVAEEDDVYAIVRAVLLQLRGNGCRVTCISRHSQANASLCWGGI